MIDEKSKMNRFVGLFLLGGFLFSYPVLTLFNTEAVFLGIPSLSFYVFSAWFGLIGLSIICTITSPIIHFHKPVLSKKNIDS